MRYCDRRKIEKARRDKSDWSDRFQGKAPVVTGQKEDEVRIPVRLDAKTVVFVRERNLHRYGHVLGGAKGVTAHRERYYRDPSAFLV